MCFCTVARKHAGETGSAAARYCYVMAPREHLIPTRTVDKNGRATTVYVKQSSTGSASPLAVVPVPSTPVDRAVERTRMINDYAKKCYPGEHTEDLRENLANSMDVYSYDLLERLSYNELGDYPSLWVSYSVCNVLPENQINEQMEFFPYLQGGTYYSVANNLIQSLHGYPRHLNHEDFSKVDEKVKGQYRALLLVTDAISLGSFEGAFKKEKPTFILNDERLVELVINNSDKAEVIVDFIRQRSGSLDADLIADVINSVSPSIGGGLL